MPVQVPYHEVVRIAQRGSPKLLEAAGRVFGLGEAEQRALLEHGLPAWLLLLGGFATGVAAGAWVHERYPSQVNRMMGYRGKRRR